MKRQYIHLSSNPEIAYQVGQRKAKSPVILTIESGKAHNHNIKFYQAVLDMVNIYHLKSVFQYKLHYKEAVQHDWRSRRVF